MKTSHLLSVMGATSLLYIGADSGYRMQLRGVNQCVLNEGIVFGIDLVPINIIYLLSVLLIGTIIWLFINQVITDHNGGNINDKRLSEYLFYTLIISGGLVNIYERIMFGNVCDYITIPNYGSLMINMSDLFITIGMIGVIMIHTNRLRGEREFDLIPWRNFR